MAKKERQTNISIQTLPNGYALTVGTKEYMYHSEHALVEGIFVHVGLGIEGYMSNETAQDLMTACATYPDSKDAITAVSRLETQIQELNGRHEKDADTISNLRKQLSAMQVKVQTQTQAQAQVQTTDTGKPKKQPNPHIIHRADVEAHPAKRTCDAAIAEIKTAKKVTKRGRRSAADALVIAELERQARENGDIL